MSQTFLSPEPRQPLLRISLLSPSSPHELIALVDSGADANIVSWETACQLWLGHGPLSRAVPVRALEAIGWAPSPTRPDQWICS